MATNRSGNVSAWIWQQPGGKPHQPDGLPPNTLTPQYYEGGNNEHEI